MTARISKIAFIFFFVISSLFFFLNYRPAMAIEGLISPVPMHPEENSPVLGAQTALITPTPQPVNPAPQQSFGDIMIKEEVGNQLPVTSSQLSTNDNSPGTNQPATRNSQPIIINPTPTPIITDIDNTTKTYTVAVLGDSMVETLGPDLYQLRMALKNYYPNAKINLLNYGVPATNAEYGLFRLTNSFEMMGRHFASLMSQNPDIIVVESFAYNPWGDSPSDIDRHWLTLAQIMNTIKTKLPQAKIIVATTIAPNANIFGDGALNWSTEAKWQKVNTIKKYLESTLKFARGENYPLADSYSPTLGSDGNGLAKYISGGDHLHPSTAGGNLFSQTIAGVIWNKKLID